jgi:sigma-B regulation protein RsbU (phosphoserine phosphatase)
LLSSVDVAQRLEVVNRVFTASTAAEHFVSLFVGEFDEASGRLQYANCGHVPPIVLRRNLRVERLEPTGTVLGWFDAWSCDTAHTRLHEGDILLVVSDGVTESMSPAGEFFGDERLVAALVANRERRTSDLVRTIADEARRFRNGVPGDDVTVVAARVRRSAAPRTCAAAAFHTQADPGE